MHLNIFENPNTRGPLARTTAGVGLTLAALGAIGFGCGVAGASPRQPILVDDPVAVPAPAAPDPGAVIDVANALLRPFNSLLNSVLPGGGSLLPGTPGVSPLSPGTPGVSPLSPGADYPSLVSPGQTPASPSYPSPLSPGQTPVDTGPVV